MEVKDLAGIGDALKKLIDVVSQGVGRVTKSYFIRKDAQAKADAIRILAEAKADAIRALSHAVDDANALGIKANYETANLILTASENEKGLSQPLLPERAASRQEYQQMREQLNIEEITSIAAEELVNEESVSSEPVDADWINRFFDSAKHVSNEQLQILWGKILAGEITQPHSYSLRTLELLQNLSKKEADIFMKAANLSISYGNGSFILIESIDLENDFGFSFGNTLLLQELGLVTNHPALALTFQKTQKSKFEVFIYGNMCIFAERPVEREIRDISIHTFTKMGKELLSIAEKETNQLYLQKFAVLLKRRGLRVKYGPFRKIGKNQWQVDETALQEFTTET